MNKYFLIAVTAFLASTVSGFCSEPVKDTEAFGRIANYYDCIWNRGNLDDIAANFSDDVQFDYQAYGDSTREKHASGKEETMTEFFGPWTWYADRQNTTIDSFSIQRLDDGEFVASYVIEQKHLIDGEWHSFRMKISDTIKMEQRDGKCLITNYFGMRTFKKELNG